MKNSGSPKRSSKRFNLPDKKIELKLVQPPFLKRLFILILVDLYSVGTKGRDNGDV